jgi:hypothetical protein
VEPIDQLPRPLLARRLGDTIHFSALLRKVCRMSGCAEDRVGEWLLKCAVGRGASHYERDFPGDLPPDNPDLSNEELAVALCLGQHPYNSVFIRAAAQLLSSARTDVRRLARLAVMEGLNPSYSTSPPLRRASHRGRSPGRICYTTCRDGTFVPRMLCRTGLALSAKPA